MSPSFSTRMPRPLLAPALVVVLYLSALLVVPVRPTPEPLLVLAFITLGILALSLLSRWYSIRPLVVLLGAYGLFGGLVVWVQQTTEAIYVTATVFTLLLALGIYGLHRYELVRLGFVGEETQ